jgi:hypothetical protein
MTRYWKNCAMSDFTVCSLKETILRASNEKRLRYVERVACERHECEQNYSRKI